MALFDQQQQEEEQPNQIQPYGVCVGNRRIRTVQHVPYVPDVNMGRPLFRARQQPAYPVREQQHVMLQDRINQDVQHNIRQDNIAYNRRLYDDPQVMSPNRPEEDAPMVNPLNGPQNEQKGPEVLYLNNGSKETMNMGLLMSFGCREKPSVFWPDAVLFHDTATTTTTTTTTTTLASIGFESQSLQKKQSNICRLRFCDCLTRIPDYHRTMLRYLLALFKASSVTNLKPFFPGEKLAENLPPRIHHIFHSKISKLSSPCTSETALV